MSTPPPNAITARVHTEMGGWGLPTIDADGLAAIALLRFANIPFSINQGASPSITSANQLPVITLDKPNSATPSICAGLASLIAMLTSDLDLADPNHNLTPFQVAESTAFATLVTSRFGPARLHEFFINDKNYADIYHTLLEKDKSFPLNRALPFMRRREIRRTLQGRSAEALYFDAGICLAALSTRLGLCKWFYGDEKPCVLDAVVFGYLAPVLYIPLASTELRQMVAKHANLVGFVGRVAQSYFSEAEPNGNRMVGELDGDRILEERRKRVEEEARQTNRTKDGRGGGTGGDDSERARWNRYFIIGSVAVFLGHVLLGHEMEFDFQ
eukprot:GFKZ01002408.1.p1 GENE.GFKZ01002408.1~~GFKZ01002408.1.p1  ORF type:complete len:379 (-),score=59.90 GFKZ01002408.1:1318-2301(-)